jgi:hypothetical protein
MVEQDAKAPLEGVKDARKLLNWKVSDLIAATRQLLQ